MTQEQRKRRRNLLLTAIIVGSIALIILLTLALVPAQTAQYAIAEQWVNAAATGDESTAFALMTEPLQTHVTENCPDGRVSACVMAYVPDEWGTLQQAVFRRSQPIGSDWDVLLIAYYEAGAGGSGVCIYTRMEQIDSGVWRVARWSGFILCNRDDAGLTSLAADDAPNRVP